jgi:CheY-like chemotaxis protein
VSSESPQPITVFLLDDHEVVRRGVADVLESDPGITVTGQAKNASEALARVPALQPDVAILDVRLPDGDGVSVCRERTGADGPSPPGPPPLSPTAARAEARGQPTHRRRHRADR